MSEATRFIVTGHVQGVGFRWAASNQARLLGLRGWVRNLSDGSVEILAIGRQYQLLPFTEWLWRGPMGSNVRDVRATLEKTQNIPECFYIQ